LTVVPGPVSRTACSSSCRRAIPRWSPAGCVGSRCWPHTCEPDRLLQLVQARYPAVVTGGVRGESVLAPYLTADLGPVPPQAAVTPVLSWLAEPTPPPPPAPTGPRLDKQPQLVIMRGPGAGLEDPRLLEPLD